MTPTVTSGKSLPVLLGEPEQPLPQTKKIMIQSGACGNCRQITRKSGGICDTQMLQCEIKTCQTWYHLSCIISTKRRRSILFSLKMGTKDFHFVCTKCLDALGDQYIDGVSSQIEHVKYIIEASNNGMNVGPEAISEGPEAIPKAYGFYKPSAIEKPIPSLDEHTYELEDGLALSQFALTRDEKFQGFEQSIIMSLLGGIHQAIYNYDRQVCWTKQLMLDGNNSYIKNPLEEGDMIDVGYPLKEWDTIDVGYQLTEGSEWFRLDDYTNTPSTSHKPITASLRQLLRTPPDKQLTISSELDNVPFSRVHMGLIYWFVLDILSNKRNLYELPNMKPMRVMMSAVSTFGDTSKCS